MNFGKLDRQVVLQQPAPAVQNGFGELTPVAAPYQDVATVWAEQKPGTGGESFLAQQQTAQQVVTWQLRHRADVQPTWRLVYAGQVYEITAVAEIGRRVGLTLTTYCRG